MRIKYNNKLKEIPSDQLHQLFTKVGWANGSETIEMITNFNLPFKNSTLVISAWIDDRLIGVIRVLSDKIIRSIIYDLAIDPDFQDQGVGKELIKRCIEFYPNSEWLVQTTKSISSYYEKIGFKKIDDDIFLNIPCKWF